MGGQFIRAVHMCCDRRQRHRLSERDMFRVRLGRIWSSVLKGPKRDARACKVARRKSRRSSETRNNDSTRCDTVLSFLWLATPHGKRYSERLLWCCSRNCVICWRDAVAKSRPARSASSDTRSPSVASVPRVAARCEYGYPPGGVVSVPNDRFAMKSYSKGFTMDFTRRCICAIDGGMTVTMLMARAWHPRECPGNGGYTFVARVALI